MMLFMSPGLLLATTFTMRSETSLALGTEVYLENHNPNVGRDREQISISLWLKGVAYTAGWQLNCLQMSANECNRRNQKSISNLFHSYSWSQVLKAARRRVLCHSVRTLHATECSVPPVSLYLRRDLKFALSLLRLKFAYLRKKHLTNTKYSAANLGGWRPRY